MTYLEKMVELGEMPVKISKVYLKHGWDNHEDEIIFLRTEFVEKYLDGLSYVKVDHWSEDYLLECSIEVENMEEDDLNELSYYRNHSFSIIDSIKGIINQEELYKELEIADFYIKMHDTNVQVNFTIKHSQVEQFKKLCEDNGFNPLFINYFKR